MSNVNIVFGSDFHIGNTKISAAETHLNLRDYFYPELEKANILFLGGDFFDRSLKLDDPSSLEVISIIQELIEFADKYNIKIRVLRGTFTHDRKQNEVFNFSLSKSKTHVDLVCIDTLSLELIQEYCLRVLYIPDNLPYKSKDEVMEVIDDLLKTYGWDYVDLVIGHGYFEHVLPPGMVHYPAITFEYDDFKSIVKGYVLMGHVHTSSIYKNIIYNGSFERFAHNEEEHKGFYIINRIDEKWSYKFIENKDTPLFYTIEVSGNDIRILQNEIEGFISRKFPKDIGYLRIVHKDASVRQTLMQCVHDNHPNIIITTKTTKESTEKKQIIRQFQTSTYISPTKENIPSLVIDFLKQVKGNTNLTEAVIKNILQLE